MIFDVHEDCASLAWINAMQLLVIATSNSSRHCVFNLMILIRLQNTGSTITVLTADQPIQVQLLNSPTMYTPAVELR